MTKYDLSNKSETDIYALMQTNDDLYNHIKNELHQGKHFKDLYGDLKVSSDKEKIIPYSYYGRMLMEEKKNKRDLTPVFTGKDYDNIDNFNVMIFDMVSMGREQVLEDEGVLHCYRSVIDSFQRNYDCKKYSCNWLINLRDSSVYNIVRNSDAFVLINSMNKDGFSWDEIADLICSKSGRNFAGNYLRTCFHSYERELIERDGEVLIYSLGDGDYHVGDMAHLPGPSEHEEEMMKIFDVALSSSDKELEKQPYDDGFKFDLLEDKKEEEKKEPLSNDEVLEIFDAVKAKCDARALSELSFNKHDEDGFNFDDMNKETPEEDENCFHHEEFEDETRKTDEIIASIRQKIKECRGEKKSDGIDWDNLYDPIEEDVIPVTKETLDIVRELRNQVSPWLTGLIGLGAGILVSGLFRRKH